MPVQRGKLPSGACIAVSAAMPCAIARASDGCTASEPQWKLSHPAENWMGQPLDQCRVGQAQLGGAFNQCEDGNPAFGTRQRRSKAAMNALTESQMRAGIARDVQRVRSNKLRFVPIC